MKMQTTKEVWLEWVVVVVGITRVRVIRVRVPTTPTPTYTNQKVFIGHLQ